MEALTDPRAAAAWLRRPAAIRARCRMVYDAAEAGALRHFALDAERLGAAARYVLETMRQSYPALDIPYHSRWRHFAVEGRDRWRELQDHLTGTPPEELARIRFDLAVTSVLLDAGAGARWRYREAGSDERYARSEGLALASLYAFRDGLFSADPGRGCRADADALEQVTTAALAGAFQADDGNPLVGLKGRAALLRRLGGVLRERPDLFGAERPRIGALFDFFKATAGEGGLPATILLDTLLQALGPIWPGRLTLDGEVLGDVWRHPAAATGDLTDGLVPFHKLSQWLAFSLVEPLEAGGVTVTGLDELTGLAEYRNGGLFLDLGVLRPKHDEVLGGSHTADSELVVEWRALTVVLLDRVAERIRADLGLSAAVLPLARVLEGGTWSAGRRIAREKRSDGRPPIVVESDGTLF